MTVCVSERALEVVVAAAEVALRLSDALLKD